jgi:hypothetical protein
MKRKILAIVLLTAVIVALLTGCTGSAPVNRPAMKSGAAAVEVTGSCEAVLNGNVLSVKGESNIADGTLGTISVYDTQGREVETVKVTKQGDNLSYDFAVTEKWPDEVFGFITFDTRQAGTQPQEIQALYGSKFENMQGPNTLWDTYGVAAVFQSEIVKIK